MRDAVGYIHVHKRARSLTHIHAQTPPASYMYYVYIVAPISLDLYKRKIPFCIMYDANDTPKPTAYVFAFINIYYINEFAVCTHETRKISILWTAKREATVLK